jgi:NADP-dependent 3-hydroxy acid dehydrogenase YdfG
MRDAQHPRQPRGFVRSGVLCWPGPSVLTIYPAGVGTNLLRKVREQLGRPHDPATTISPKTLASVVLIALEFPDDGHLMEITLRPATRGARR